MNDYIHKLAEEIGAERARQIDELGAAFLLKTKASPRKIVLIQHTDYQTGKTFSWYEKKRWRSRKEIITNLEKTNN